MLCTQFWWHAWVMFELVLIMNIQFSIDYGKRCDTPQQWWRAWVMFEYSIENLIFNSQLSCTVSRLTVATWDTSPADLSADFKQRIINRAINEWSNDSTLNICCSFWHYTLFRQKHCLEDLGWRGGLVVGRRTCDLWVAGSRPGRDAAA